MLTQEQKLKAFLTAIDDYAEKQRSRILADLDSSNRIAVEKAEKETLDDAYEIISQRTSAVRMQVSRDIAKRESDAKNELIRKRNDIEAAVFAKAAEKLREYAKTAAYSAQLIKLAEKASNSLNCSDGTVIFMRHEDIVYKDDVINAFGKSCTVCEDDSIKLGGLRFENDEACRAIDATFDSALYSQRDEFARLSGLKVI